MGNKTFPPSYRLKDQRIIRRLNDRRETRSVKVYPFVLAWVHDRRLSAPLQVMLNVSRKRFRKAVTRNVIKRQLRELFREKRSQLTKHTEVSGKEPIALMIVYIGKESADFRLLREKFNKLLSAFEEHFKESR